MLIHAVDASIPPPTVKDLPHGVEAILGYLGAPGRTPNVWTKAEWAPFEPMLQMGIWVADLTADPVDQALAAALAAAAMGFSIGRGVLGDFEDNADPAFIGEWGLQLRQYGYIPLGYESTGVLAANPRLDGVVLAQPNQPPVVPVGQLIVGRQYKWNVAAGPTVVDLDVFDSSVKHLFGRGPR